MRRKIAIGTLGFMILLAAAIISWAQQAPPQGGNPGQGQRQMAGGGQHQWGGGGQRQWAGNGQHKFAGGGPGQFRRQGMRRGPGGRMMGMRRGGGGRMGMQRGGGRGFGGGGGEGLLSMAGNPRVRQMLGLTDAQVARLHTISVDAQKASVQTRADMQLRHIELRELMRGDNPDQSAIMAKLDEVNALQGKMEKERVQTMLSARGVLTADQIKKIKAARENRGAGPGPGPGPGPRGMGMRGGQGRPGGAPAGAAAKPKEPAVQ